MIAAWGLAAPFGLNALQQYQGDRGPALMAPAAVLQTTSTFRSNAGGAISAPGFATCVTTLSVEKRNVGAIGGIFPVCKRLYGRCLPLVARDRIAGGPQIYSILLGAIGARAIGCAFCLPRLKRWLGPDRLVICLLQQSARPLVR